jgi:hypothetical protein
MQSRILAPAFLSNVQGVLAVDTSTRDFFGWATVAIDLIVGVATPTATPSATLTPAVNAHTSVGSNSAAGQESPLSLSGIIGISSAAATIIGAVITASCKKCREKREKDLRVMPCESPHPYKDNAAASPSYWGPPSKLDTSLRAQLPLPRIRLGVISRRGLLFYLMR